LRVGDAIFALHDVLILRGDRGTQARRRATDSRLRPAPHWGCDRWVPMPLDEVSDQELPGLLSQVRGLVIGKKR
jgi:hypothetical protein